MKRFKLPIRDFSFLTSDEIRDRFDDFKYGRIDFDSDIGYMLKVDLEYPEDLHDKHNDYPLAPERLTVTDDMLGPYARTYPNRPKPMPKLVPNLQNKEKYVLHYLHLKLYLDLGMKLTRIHRVLEFKLEAWMRAYVDLCTNKRKDASTDFEKDFWKLCVNAVFGKSMENIRHRVNVRLIHDPVVGIKAASKPTFESSKIVNDDLVMVHMKKMRILLNKPIYTGFAILDLSKVIV